MLALQLILLPLIVLFCGLSIDVGLLELKKAQMQTAADAAALGGALEAERGTNNWISLGQSEAAQNGFTNGSNNVTVALQYQPTTGAYANNYQAIEATITQKVQTVFMGALNGGKVTLEAKAAALVTPCVFLTGTTLQTYTFDGQNGAMKGESCPISINNSLKTDTLSLAPEALNIAGPASASDIQGYQWPTPFNYNAPTVADPLSSIAEPTFSGTCNHTNYSLYNVSSNTTLSPGTYCGGLNITNSNATLSPGLYVITGGGTWYNSTVTGTGVTLFFTAGGGSADSKFILSYANVTLSAPTTSSDGSIAGILVFTDRNWTHTNPQDVDISQSNFTGDGIWYLPSTGLYLQNSGTITGNAYMGLVADNLTIVGTTFVPMNNYTSLQSGNPMRRQGALVQ